MVAAQVTMLVLAVVVVVAVAISKHQLAHNLSSSSNHEQLLPSVSRYMYVQKLACHGY
ncbi:hypothetical protein K440DRAFT_389954 [Wilcoxina mikolae CBS 423.85]|nr:hypothetical protein K440DRAFT_389954 [Wilcoxina mikolae CBS 423.85]